jgi:hypothetical protein
MQFVFRRILDRIYEIVLLTNTHNFVLFYVAYHNQYQAEHTLRRIFSFTLRNLESDF